MPLISSSTSVPPGAELMTRSPRGSPWPTRHPTASSAGHLVPGLLHGGTDGLLVDRLPAGHGERAAGEVDVDPGDAGDLGDLLGDRADAVGAGHADDGVGAVLTVDPFGRSGWVRNGRVGRSPRRPR